MRNVLKICFCLIFLCCSLISNAEKRVALIIGNADYSHSDEFHDLSTPVNDANEIKSQLDKLGFKDNILIGHNCSREEMLTLINRFRESLTNADVAVFFYSGHGGQIDNNFYLVPSDINSHETIELDCVNFGGIRTLMENKALLSFSFLDACRTTFAITGKDKGSVPRKAKKYIDDPRPQGSITFYATEHGYNATTGDGRLSPFTEVLAKHLSDEGEFYDVWRDIAYELTNTYNQSPSQETLSGYVGKFYFNTQENTISKKQEQTQNQDKISIRFNLAPSTAVIEIGDKQFKSGTLLKFEKGESYFYKVKADGYVTKEDEIIIKENMPSVMDIQLSKLLHTTLDPLYENTPDIVLDGEIEGETPLYNNKTTVAFTPVKNLNAQNSKVLKKELKKECKRKLKELTSDGWKISGSTRTLEIALLHHYEKLYDENNRELVGEASVGRSIHLLSMVALNNATLKYASMSGAYLRGRIVSDSGINQSREDNSDEFDRMFMAYETLVEKEIKGEISESFSIVRDLGNGMKEFKTFFIVNEEAASKARIRAWQRIQEES